MHTENEMPKRDDSIDNPHLMYSDIKQRLIDVYNTINIQEKEISVIEERLNSFTFSAWEFLGLGAGVDFEDEISDEALLDSPSESLSRVGLERKLDTLKNKVSGMQTIISSLEIKARQLENKIKQENAEVRSTDSEESKIKAVAKYLTNTDKFFAEVLFNEPLSQQTTDAIYRSARQIIAASTAIAACADRYKVTEAWKIVSEARNRSLAEYGKAMKGDDEIKSTKLAFRSEEFLLGAKVAFAHMVDKLDTGWQGLKFLYEVEPMIAEYYFANIGTSTVNIQMLMNEIHATHVENARLSLERNGSFMRLSVDVKEQLVNQLVYVKSLEFDLSSLPDINRKRLLSTIEQQKNMLAENIDIAINSNKSLDEIKAEETRIRQEIDKEASIIRRQKFKEQLTESAQIPLGAGLGVAWVLGAGLTAAAATVLIVAAGKAALETSSGRMQIPKIDESKKLLDEVGPEKFDFIKQADKRWKSADTDEESVVHIQTLADDSRALMNKAGAELQKKYQENVEKPLEVISNQVTGYYLGIVGASALSLVALSIAFPFIWPLFATIGGIALVGAGYVVAQKIIHPAQEAPSLLGPLVDKGYNFAARMGRNVREAANSLLKGMKSTGVKGTKVFAKPITAKATESTFMIPAKSLQALKSMSPNYGDDFAAQIIKHFQRRLTSIQNQLAVAQSAVDKNSTKELRDSIKELEHDWSKILASGSDPDKFCKTVNDYLEDSYQQARQKFLSNDRMTMVFGNAINKQANNKADIEELIKLKTIATRVKIGV